MVHRKSSSASVGGQKPLREDLQDGEGMGRRAETTMHGRGASSSGSGVGDSASGNCGDASQRLDAARSELLRSKQAELDAIEDKHDDLVRFLSFFVSAHSLAEGVVTPQTRFVSFFCGLCRYAKRFILNDGRLWLRMILLCVPYFLSFHPQSPPLLSLVVFP
jgi:hypothetical protein